MMKDDDFKMLRGFASKWTDRQTNGRTDICECRVAFATEKCGNFPTFPQQIPAWPPLIVCGQIWTRLAVACFQMICLKVAKSKEKG